MVIPVPRLKFYRRVNALSILVDAAMYAPERLVRALLHLWQTKSFPLLAAERIPWGTSGLIEHPAIQDFAEWLIEQPFNEAAYWLATAYAIWVGEETRTQRALFFTPPRLADRVISNLVDHGASLTEHHWHDPACGGAAFLVPIAQQMATVLEKSRLTPLMRLKRIEANLSGNDLDPVLLKLSGSFLEMALYELVIATGRRPRFRLFEGDGLTSKSIEELRPDVVACNPPYRKLKSVEMPQYIRLHREVTEGQPNIYGLFINRTLQLTRLGGLVGLLTPTSFLSGQSFSKLRTKLLSASDLLQIDMLSDRTSMFIDVEQEVAITILRTKLPDKAVSRHTDVSVSSSAGDFNNVGRYLLPNSGRPWPIPRAVEDAALLRSAEERTFRLSDYGYVARVGLLVAYRDARPRFARMPVRSKRVTIVPLVWATDISPDGGFEHGRVSRLKRARAYVQVQGLSDHGVLTKPVVLLQRLTSSDQRSRIVAAAVPTQWIVEHGGFICENHVIVLEPIRQDAMSPEAFAQLLNSKAVDRVFRSISGASNVAVSELNELLLPDPSRLAHFQSVVADPEAAVRAAYGLALT